MNILGLSAFFHESACCLLQDGRLVAAASEERFSRVKHDPRLPVDAFRHCLEAGGIDLTEVDCLAYYERPVAKLGRQLWSGTPASVAGGAWLDPRGALRLLRERLGYDGPIRTFDHHASHAASAFFFSGFEEAAVLTADGVGEWATTTLGHGRGAHLELLAETQFPHSIGLLYSTVTAYLGFEVNDGEFKVMGLAPYGEPTLADRLSRLVRIGDGGRYALDTRFFAYPVGERMHSPLFEELVGFPPRRPGEPLEAHHHDLARSVQLVLESLLLELVDELRRRTGAEDLCFAGGVALNCVANARLLREGPFRRLFVPPAAGDAGGAVGAAALAHVELTGERPAVAPLCSAGLGPAFSPDHVAAVVRATDLPAEDYRGRTVDLLERVADALAERRVVGWFHGPMEFGPRALGARSILANPMDPGIRDRLNALVKKREAFRPFAPSVLAAQAGRHFDLDHPSPFMLETCQVRSALELPGITHVDGSARPQTVHPETSPRFAALLEAFHRRTGCPMLVNTSFNVRGEPIVCTPVDALFCFVDAGLDLLVLEDFVLRREDLPAELPELLAPWRTRQRSGFAGRKTAVPGPLYTFV
ncbi:MAG: carbamoyltransferase [Acidobacteria bacterium]|nr:carbamoyltransferase [Acidobacteriota bacterium]